MPRRRNFISPEDKRRIIEKYEANEDFLVTAAELGIKRTTAYGIIRCYQRNGHLEDGRVNSGRKRKIDDESLDFLVMMIEATPTITINELNQALRESFPAKPHVCDSTVSRALDASLITLKKCENVPQDRNSAAVKEARVQYAHYMYEEGLQKHRIYIDETGFHLYTKRMYGRAARGERAIRVVGGQRGGNISLIAAISDVAGLVYYEMHTQSVTKEIFASFLTSLDVILGDEEAVLIMDNAPCHRDAGQVIQNHEVKYLPPHSPFLNPIENCFAVLKATLKHHINDIAGNCTTAAARRAGRTLRAHREQQLKGAMEMALGVVTPELTGPNYRHSNRFLMQCLNSHDIWA